VLSQPSHGTTQHCQAPARVTSSMSGESCHGNGKTRHGFV